MSTAGTTMDSDENFGHGHGQGHGTETEKGSAMKPKTKIKIASILALVGVVVALVAIKGGQIGAMIKAGKSFVPPPESVTSAKVESAEWQPTKAAIGTLVAVQAVQLSAELTGIVREIGFDSGKSVKKGDVLVRLDTSTERAQLDSAEAEASLAKLNLERARMLRKGESNSQADLDSAEARAKQSTAVVAGLRATIAKKIIRAPFDGRIAIKQVELGQVLSPGAPIASLQSVDPIYAEFSLPQQALAEVKLGQQSRMRTDIFPEDTWDGKLSTINSEVDIGTRNVRVRATFPNADGRLRPGMFVNVEVLANEKRPVVFIPATSILYAPYGDSVFVIEDKDAQPQQAAQSPEGEKTQAGEKGKAETAKADEGAKGGKDAPSGPAGKDAATPGQGAQPGLVVHQRFIRLGEKRGDMVAVISGLKPGEVVASSGAFKLRNGMNVVVNNDLSPSAEIAPNPTDK